MIETTCGLGVGQRNAGGGIEVTGYNDNSLALGIRTLGLLSQNSCWLHSSSPAN